MSKKYVSEDEFQVYFSGQMTRLVMSHTTTKTLLQAPVEACSNKMGISSTSYFPR